MPPYQSMWAEREQDESLLTAHGAVHNVRSSAQHLSTPLRSILLSAQHRFHSTPLQNDVSSTGAELSSAAPIQL